MAKWQEVSHAKDNNRRELLLKGKEIAERIALRGLDKRIFNLSPLNFLEISDAGIEELPSEIGNLSHLLNLTLRGNKLVVLPDSIGKLTRLQFLDASRNSIENVPDSLGCISSIHTLDLSQNKLSVIPESFNNLSNLAYLNFSRNSLTDLDVMLRGNLHHLGEVLASHNQIETIPSGVGGLESLRTLDLSENKLQEFPARLSLCPKLKELHLVENPVKDRRLKKLIQQTRGTKPILEYIAAHGKKEEAEDVSAKSAKKGKRKKKSSQSKDEETEQIRQRIEVMSFRNSSDPLEIKACKSVVFVRPYIACCIVRNLDLSLGNRFKQFISAQTKLHDGPLCAKRTTATIATHDLKCIKGPLTYEGKSPSSIELTPLGKTKAVTAESLMKQLNQEADELRKELKRNTVSGIHKYLSLLAHQELYPTLLDAAGHVISLPPITNSDVSKISRSTTDILIEVTSSEDLASCKKVLQALLAKMLELNLGSKGEADEGAGAESTSEDKQNKLVVEQVRVVNEDGDLRVIYPSKTDLEDLPGVTVIRQ
ncbi:leucine-rich repeat-containing protein 47-like [Lytechinus pictus]|uniref:leucine-rich repeat-containing protein 47-like n=1 Tax=Lytechinus pictus TaxID=7653 RepID=UPI0030B9BF87